MLPAHGSALLHLGIANLPVQPPLGSDPRLGGIKPGSPTTVAPATSQSVSPDDVPLVKRPTSNKGNAPATSKSLL
jgi:hypothetical protein